MLLEVKSSYLISGSDLVGRTSSRVRIPPPLAPFENGEKTVPILVSRLPALGNFGYRGIRRVPNFVVMLECCCFQCAHFGDCCIDAKAYRQVDQVPMLSNVRLLRRSGKKLERLFLTSLSSLV
jgi:hypothetical protein